ncbi:MAG: DUF2497 domain-containing protein [Beijerinckiaceae bacterium]|nr:MAG: DUF2497 domain-containing protein [Beijerinckiaceae bacterium]
MRLALARHKLLGLDSLHIARRVNRDAECLLAGKDRLRLDWREAGRGLQERASKIMNAPNPLTSEKHDSESKGYEPSMEEILASIRRIIADDQAFSQRPIPPEETSGQTEPSSEPAPSPETRASVRAKPFAELRPASGEPKPFTESNPSELGRAAKPAVEAKPVAQPSGVTRVMTAASPSEAGKQSATKETVAASAPAEADGQAAPGFPVEAQFQVFKTAVRPLAAAARLAETPKTGAAGGEAGAFLQGQLPEPLPEGSAPLVSAKTDATVASAFETLVASRFVQESEGFSEIIREMARPMLKAWLDDNLPILVERLVRAEIERVARGGR